jgi:hypothetical protein
MATQITNDVRWVVNERDEIVGAQVGGRAASLVSGGGTLAAASKTFGIGSGGTAVGAGTTLVTQHPLDFAIVGVQGLWTNQSGAPITVTKAVAASTPVHQDIASTATWKNFTFAGSASGVVPASPGGAGSDIRSGYLLSDYLPILSVPRTDDTTKTPLLQVRTYFAAAGNGLSTSAGEIAAWNAGPAAYGRQFAARAPAGDMTATFTASQQPLEAGTWVLPTMLICYFADGVKSVAVVGDSLSKGHLTTGGATSWPAVTTGMLRVNAGKRYGFNNVSWTGQSQAASISVGKELVAQVKPDYMCFFGWSPNDLSAAATAAATTVPLLSTALSQATFDDGYSRAVEFGQWLVKEGIKPVVCTSGAWNTMTSAQNAMRRANNTRLLALRSLGWIVIDFASVIDNPANTDQINPTYNQGDGLHYNDAGHVAMATLAAAAFP